MTEFPTNMKLATFFFIACSIVILIEAFLIASILDLTVIHAPWGIIVASLFYVTAQYLLYKVTVGKYI